MTPEDRLLMTQEIQKAVKETVNGKIAALDKKLDGHMEEIRPYMQAASGVKVIGNSIKWFAAVGVAWIVIQGWLTGKI